MSQLRLYLLGTPHIEHAGSPVHIDRRKALALLAYLAVSGSSHSRDALATLLWPDSKPQRAYAYLRNALWVLNQTPVEAYLAVERETVGLRRDAQLCLDVQQFHHHLAAVHSHGHTGQVHCPDCLSRLAAAVDLYAGDFMAGFSLDDSPAFDEWTFFQAETLRQELAWALEVLVQNHTRLGEFEPAIAYTRRWLALDPLNECLQRQMMTLYARSGQQAAALRQYEESVRVLQEELGLLPGKETVELYERIVAGYPRDLTFAPTPPHNLPPQATPFVGREAELAEIRQLLDQPACRLLTIVGPGGSGKSRLALEAARQACERDPSALRQGIFWVPLAPVSAPEFIIPTIADALPTSFSQRGPEIPPAAGRGIGSLQAQFLEYLAGKNLLLVLDNLEHLLPDIDLIQEILQRAAGVKLLLTSRERLNLQGEWVLEIAGLRVPAEDVPLEAYETYGAVQLFLQSAQRAQVGFTPSPEDLAAVGRICRLVAGIPLGIELAAVWVKALSCQEIAGEIESNLDFLTTSLRDVPERHRSLRAVFAQSWSLLSGEGRACFRKLAIFRGGFTREAAHEVAEASLAALSSLLDKSLLQRTSAGRYEMQEVLRQYAEERLAMVPRESDVVRDRHSQHYLALLQQLELPLKTAGQKAALDALAREIENLRLAWRWAIARGNFRDIHRAALSLFLFYDMRSRFQEGGEMFGEAARALSTPGTSAPPRKGDQQLGEQDRQALLGLLHTTEGWFFRHTAPVKSRALLEKGLAYLEPLGRRWELAFARTLGDFSSLWTTLDVGADKLRDSFSIYQELDDRWGMAIALEALAGTFRGKDNAAAVQHIQQGLELRRQLGDRWGIALALYVLGRIAEARGEYVQAKERFRESMSLRRELGLDQDGVASCLEAMGRMAFCMGDYRESQTLYLEGLALGREVGNRWHVALFLDQLGQVALALDAPVEAQVYWKESLALHQELGLPSEAIRQALAGAERMLLAQRMAAAPYGQEEAGALVEPLSEREREVLQLLATGRSNKQIAEELFIATGTVKNHLKNIYGKLGAHNRTQAVARARELGLL